MKKLSVGVRLTLWYLLLFAAAQLVFGIGMWFLARRSLYQITDDALRGQIDDLTNFLQAQKKNATVAKLQEEVAEAYLLEHSGDYLQIYDDSDGAWIFRSDFLKQHALTLPGHGRFAHAHYRNEQLGRPLRFVIQRIEANGRVFTVQTGLPIDQVNQILVLFRGYLLMFAPVLLLGAASVGFWLSRKALSPVDAITRSARTINATNLSDRLEKLTTGDELQRLSDTLNEMLGRIEHAFVRVTQFTADASHELRTPISLIRTEAEIALRRSRGDGEYREALRHILLEAERTTGLVEELLSLARADSGRETLHISAVDLSAIVREVGEQWRDLMDTRALTFTREIVDQEVTILGDRDALRRLITVLLDNAAKYTPAPGTVRLRLETSGSSAVIQVCDSGIGIALEDQPKIFERFYRVDKARGRDRMGAGIGLAIAQWIAQQHQGLITVQSRPGAGATFLVKLPLRETQVEVAGSHRRFAADDTIGVRRSSHFNASGSE
ncbi:MAG TPA: ATP-binding protein [Terriglobales bacterium]|nr:ATP-binding protein [Terriglobales bacterium]